MGVPQSFEKSMELTRVSEDEHTVVIPDGWQQGRGAFGGLVVGILMEAMASREADPLRAPRAFTADLCGPALARESSVRSRILRRGNNQTNLAASFEQDGALVAHATCVLSLPRHVATPPTFAFAPPTRVPFDEVPIVDMGPPNGPTFGQHYEFRPTGPLPFRGGKEAVITGWLRERIPITRLTAAVLLARLDAHWPAIFSVETTFRPIATVSFLAEILCDPTALDPAKPLFYRSRVVAEAGGYLVEMRELWDEDRPVALNQQSIALLA